MKKKFSTFLNFRLAKHENLTKVRWYSRRFNSKVNCRRFVHSPVSAHYHPSLPTDVNDVTPKRTWIRFTQESG